MKDCEMTPHEILNAIGADLDGDARNMWVGMCHQDRQDCVIAVQRGEASIEEVQVMLRDYVEEIAV